MTLFGAFASAAVLVLIVFPLLMILLGGFLENFIVMLSIEDFIDEYGLKGVVIAILVVAFIIYSIF